ncbi:MAG: hypothetical protein DMF20_08015 [Verrucomicrobia bacterium]|nr:MAG: hypothetical protein DMF20_08015 [Verrucomicrobiota bacterium]
MATHLGNVAQSRSGRLWGAHTSRVLVSAPRRNRLPLRFLARPVSNSQGKSAIARTRSPARGTCALPGTRELGPAV